MLERLFLTFFLSYVLGSLSFSYLVVRLSGKGDLRTLGTGNLGARNVKRFLGWSVAIAVGILDAAKGAGAVYLGQYLLREMVGSGPFGMAPLRWSGPFGMAPLRWPAANSGGLGTALVKPLTTLYPAVGPLFFRPEGLDIAAFLGGLLGAVGAVTGHNYSLFLGFKGGKGLATSAGALLVLTPWVLAVSLLWGGLVLVLGGGLYRAAIAMALQLPLTFWLFLPLPAVFWLSLSLSLIVLSRHRRHFRQGP